MIEQDRLIQGQLESRQEEVQERALRPRHLDDYVGQK
ncbi:MAG: Holliday junction branch migration DNA helicase RuvB, partial [Ferrovum sp.]|nr:Holliday junction branch migration DNA helicase RuvB [Ferrovum sp.]